MEHAPNAIERARPHGTVEPSPVGRSEALQLLQSVRRHVKLGRRRVLAGLEGPRTGLRSGAISKHKHLQRRVRRRRPAWHSRQKPHLSNGIARPADCGGRESYGDSTNQALALAAPPQVAITRGQFLVTILIYET